RAQRRVRRRRARRPVDLRVRGARHDLPDRGALRRPRPPAPPAAHRRTVPGALQRRAAGGRLRRAGHHPRRLPRRGLAGNARAGHRHPDHLGAQAAHRPRHGRRAGGARRRGGGRLPARLGARAGPRRAARGGGGAAAQRPRGADRPRVLRARRRTPPVRGARPHALAAVPGVPRHPRGQRPAGRAAVRPAARPRDGSDLMRPVLLEMTGFGSFREPTTVDFTGADYFALVGPTGAGKSTVIDAMTFALYGSVPRWDNARTVALALAPTINRGTVRLVFDVGGDRYVVARELRRAASGGVSVRGARLEKLRDPSGTGAADEESEPLADGAGPVTKAVEELLGLPFGDFCTCVVLPQGEFAEFLHTEPRKRREKLVRILGLGVYDVIAREANSEAAAQRQRAEVLTEQLAGYADATEEAEREAAARVAELAELAGRVEAAVPELAAASAALESAEAGAAQLRAERDRLAALTVPDGLADLDARYRSATEQRAKAAERAAEAEAADTAARERLAAAPARGPLEQARRDHAELAAIRAELPGVRERHEKA